MHINSVKCSYCCSNIKGYDERGPATVNWADAFKNPDSKTKSKMVLNKLSGTFILL